MTHIQKARLEVEDKLPICTEIMENLSNHPYRVSLFTQNIQITDWIGTYTSIWGSVQWLNGNVDTYSVQDNYPNPSSDHDTKSILLFLISCDFDYLLPLYSMSQMNLDIDFINDLFDDDYLKAKAIFESFTGG